MGDWNWLDPLGSLRDAVVDAYKWQVGVIEKIIYTPLNPVSDARVLELLYLQGENLALYLAYAVFGVILVVSVFLMNGKKLVEALVVFVVVVAITPVWVRLVDEMYISGLSLAKALAFFDAPKVDAIQGTAGVIDPLAGIALYVPVFLLGLGVALQAVSFEFGVVLFKLIMMPAASLYAAGPRTRKVVDAIFALGIVSAMLGRPALTFYLEAGQWASATLPFGKTSFGAAVFTAASYLSALCFVLILAFACYKGIAVIEGKVTAMASGATAAFKSKIERLDTRSNSPSASRPMPVILVQPEVSFREKVTNAGKKAAREGVKKAAALAVA